jgi:tetratricopeptide (TPR) repeat protein
MTDVVMLEVIKSLFYSAALLGITLAFGKQIRNFLDSIGSLKVAGASFSLGDNRETTESYALLADILIKQLSSIQNINALLQSLTSQDVEQLGKFATKYISAVPKDKWNEEMLRNIGYLLQFSGRCEQSVALFDSLLKIRPDHYDFLDNKGFALLRHGGQAQLVKAEQIFLTLTERDRASPRNHYRLACARSGLKKAALAVESMTAAVEVRLLKQFPEALSDPMLHFARSAEPEAFAALAERMGIVQGDVAQSPGPGEPPRPGDIVAQG